MSNARAHVYIQGRVQGVFFRATAREKAVELGIHGWVKNCLDGRVEAVFEGKNDAIDKMINWCRRGPVGAVVDDVQIHTEKFSGKFDEFSIIY
ncbi:MAG: acylphosphatase [Candidatus Kuenenia sp.]|nr:acylphosphatase [Candidatus Kuenenia hertensis]